MGGSPRSPHRTSSSNGRQQTQQSWTIVPHEARSSWISFTSPQLGHPISIDTMASVTGHHAVPVFPQGDDRPFQNISLHEQIVRVEGRDDEQANPDRCQDS